MAVNEWVVVRLKVQDRNKFIADMKAAGYSTRGLGNEVERTGKLFQRGAHHGFLWNQMLFTLRRTIYSVTLALGALGAAGIVMGFKFNSMIEQQSLAFRKFTGSVAAGSREVNYLFNLAAHGPFSFQQIIQGARQLLAFNYTVKDTNTLLVALQDAMAGMGLTEAQLQRATLALGEIRSIGVLQGRQVRQLEQLGLLNREVLAKGLGITTAQAGNVGRLAIPWQQAIQVITAYWRQRFKGSAADFQKTWVGQWSTFKDYSSQTFGYIIKDLQNKMEHHGIPSLTRFMQTAGAGARTGGITGAFTAIDIKYGTNLLAIWTGLVFVLRQVWSIAKDVVIIFSTGAARIGAGAKLLYLLGGALWIIARALHILAPVLSYVITLWIAERTAILLLTLATKRYIIWEAIQIAWNKRKIYWTGLMIAADYAYVTALYIGTAAMGIWTEGAIFARAVSYSWIAILYAVSAAQYVLGIATGIVSAAFWDFAFAVAANPLTWLVVAAVALVAGLVVLYYKWDTFHRAVDRTFHFIQANWGSIKLALTEMFTPIMVALEALKYIIAHIQQIQNFANHPFKGVDKSAGNGPMTILGVPLSLPHLATGGHVLSGGLAMVGERGREVVSLPSGASVTPVGSAPAMGLGRVTVGRGGNQSEIRIPLYLDGRQIAEGVARVWGDVAAMG